MSITARQGMALLAAGASYIDVKARVSAVEAAAFEKEYWNAQSLDVEYSGTKIVLPGDPENMNLLAAAAYLEKTHKARETKVDVLEIYEDVYPFEAILAIHKALKQVFGSSLTNGSTGWFGRPENTSYYAVRTGPAPEDFIQIPTGNLLVPNFDADLTVDISGGRAYMKVCCKSSERHRVNEVISLSKEIIRDASIYKNRAIFLDMDSDGDLIDSYQPEFLDLTGTDESRLIHNSQTMAALELTVWDYLRNTEACRKNGISVGRRAILAGDYGTGKTMSMRVTAKIALEHGWTFVLLKEPRGLEKAIKFAARYQPCLLGVEDFDRAAKERTDDFNIILNETDGIVNNREVMIFTTTNSLDDIHPAMLRPGRMDSVIPVLPPDSEAAERLIRSMTGGALPDSTNIGQVVAKATGMHPAFIGEFVGRAVMRTVINPDYIMTEADLMRAYESIVPHYESWCAKSGRTRGLPKSPEDALAQGIVGLLRMAGAFPQVEKSLNGIAKMTDEIRDAL